MKVCAWIPRLGLRLYRHLEHAERHRKSRPSGCAPASARHADSPTPFRLGTSRRHRRISIRATEGPFRMARAEVSFHFSSREQADPCQLPWTSRARESGTGPAELPIASGPSQRPGSGAVDFPASKQQGHDLSQGVLFGTNCSEETRQSIDDCFFSRPRMPLLDHASRPLWIPYLANLFSSLVWAAESRG